MQAVINACKELKDKAGKEDWVITPDEESPKYYSELQEKYTDQIKNAFTIKLKSERSEAISKIKEDIVNSYSEADDIQLGKVLGAFKNLEKDIVRQNIFSNFTYSLRSLGFKLYSKRIFDLISIFFL